MNFPLNETSNEMILSDSVLKKRVFKMINTGAFMSAEKLREYQGKNLSKFLHDRNCQIFPWDNKFNKPLRDFNTSYLLGIDYVISDDVTFFAANMESHA